MIERYNEYRIHRIDDDPDKVLWCDSCDNNRRAMAYVTHKDDETQETVCNICDDCYDYFEDVYDWLIDGG